MSMKSLEALVQLQKQKEEKERKKAQVEEIQSQLEKIALLQEKKEALYRHLLALQEGEDVDQTLHPHDNEEIRGLRREFVQLKERVQAHHVIGPCGLTVLELTPDQLVVSFTGLWRTLAENYLLKITLENDKYTVGGSTIPYFMNVQALIDKAEKPPNWRSLLDQISRLISAYTQRKGEFQDIQNNYTDLITSLTANDPVTVIDLTLTLPGPDDVIHSLQCHLRYPGLESTLPEEVEIDTETMLSDSPVFPEAVITEVKNKLKTQSLTAALAYLLTDGSSVSSEMTESSLGTRPSVTEEDLSVFSSQQESQSTGLPDQESQSTGLPDQESQSTGLQDSEDQSQTEVRLDTVQEVESMVS